MSDEANGEQLPEDMEVLQAKFDVAQRDGPAAPKVGLQPEPTCDGPAAPTWGCSPEQIATGRQPPKILLDLNVLRPKGLADLINLVIALIMIL